MNTLKSIAVFLSVLLFAEAQGQNRIFATSQQLSDTTQAKAIKNIKLSWGNLGKKIKVTYADGTDSLIEKNSLWGYQRAKEPVTRIFKRTPYEVLEAGYVVIYKSSNVNGTTYFFSKDLNSDLKTLNQKKLRKELGDDGYLKATKGSALLRSIID